MGNYFVMSMRFNKNNAYDFGLVFNDMNTATNPKDNSIWIKAALYDFGWGRENGFYKYPLPDFETLFNLVLYSTNREDIYGAAAIILEKYPDELLCQCEGLMNDRSRNKEFKKLVKIFKLNVPMNRSAVVQKTHDQIQNDYKRWRKVLEMAEKV